METEQSQSQSQVPEFVDDILITLRSDMAIDAVLRTAVDDVYNLYHTAMRADILNILIPIVLRLKRRIEQGDLQFFAGSQFVPTLTKAVQDRCEEVIKSGKMTRDGLQQTSKAIVPILTAIQRTAVNYLKGDVTSFESIIERMAAILSALSSTQR